MTRNKGALIFVSAVTFGIGWWFAHTESGIRARIAISDAISPCSILISGTKTTIDGIEVTGAQRPSVICATNGSYVKVTGTIVTDRPITGGTDGTGTVILPDRGIKWSHTKPL